MQRMIQSRATPGLIGQPWWLMQMLPCMELRANYARPLNRVWSAAAVERAGIKMSKKFTTKNTKHGGLRIRPAIINEIHEQWCRDNGYTSNERLHQENIKPVRWKRKQQAQKTNKQAEAQAPWTRDPGPRTHKQNPYWLVPGSWILEKVSWYKDQGPWLR